MGPFESYSDHNGKEDDVEDDSVEEDGDGDTDDEDQEEKEEEKDHNYNRKRKYKGSQFMDDVVDEEDDDEEDEEDEEDGEVEEAPRKRRHPRGLKFIDDTAAVASDDDEEEDDAEEDFIQDEPVDIQNEEDRGQWRHHRSILPEDEGQEDIEDLEKLIGQWSQRQDVDEYSDAETTEVEQQALLPSVKDPKLWMVRCHSGHEREASICLMQKYLDMGMQAQPLLIKSAIALDHLKGYLYIESEKEAYVRQAIKGMRMIFQSTVKLVPIKEMTDVLSVEKKSVDIDQDKWVRVKSGNYKGDLAKVVNVDHVRQRATIKLIPRIDLQAEAVKLGGRNETAKGKPAKGKPRPPPRFISLEEVRDLRIPVERKRDPHHTGEYFEFFGGMQFKDGYFFKVLSLKSIDSRGIVPSFDELQKFQKSRANGALDAMGLPAASMSRRKGQFVKGDVVVVMHGDLKNLKGIVVKVDDDDVYIRPKDEDLHDSLLIKESHLCKVFKTGDHVKVIAGMHEGAAGMIVKVDTDSVVILSDITREDIKVFTSNIVESSDVTAGLNKLGDYELHDLVLLDRSTVGLIMRLDRDGCQILKGTPNRAEVVNVKQRDMLKKVYDRNVNAHDRDANVISLRDVVKVVEGPFKGRQGPVEHLSRGILFILDRHHPENGGFLCARSQWCVALGGSRSGMGRGRERGVPSNFNGVSGAPPSYLQSPRHSPQNFGPQTVSTFRGLQGGSKRDHSLVGTTVKIRIGPYKGYRGRVVDATNTDVRVELESQMKVVTVKQSQLSDSMDGSSYRESPWYDVGSDTPLHPSRTPMHPAFMTPVRDPSANRIHEGMRTPMRDRAWNPHTTMNTPLRDIKYDSADASTWIAGTPGYERGAPGGRQYEAPTPGSGWENTPGAGFDEFGTPAESSGPAYGNPAIPYLPGTPGGLPVTHGLPSYLPSTPGGQPMTPGSRNMDPMSPAPGCPGHEADSKWELPEVSVTLRKGGEDSQMAVILEAMPDGSCRVALGSAGDGDVVTVSRCEMELVVPRKTDRVKIVSGELRLRTGKLIAVDGPDGIVKMDDTLDIKILDMSSVARMVAN